jgi:diadenosine tetraphosphate (Ap4A) HIT family hydrolase
MDCVFCEMPRENIIFSKGPIFACFDIYPVSPGHTLIITERHIGSWFETTAEERKAIDDAIFELKDMLDTRFSPDGYNIGVNIGRDAGQTIDHLHVHLIPRYREDMEDPWGGVRGVIPDKRMYPKK